MQTIVTLTMNSTLDKSAGIDRVVAEDKLRCHSLRYEPGGGGINVSRAIHKLGGQAKTLYTSGGSTGDTLQELLTQEALEHYPLAIQAWTREGLTVLEESTNRQFRFNLPGPHLHPKEWAQALDQLFSLKPKPAYLVASGSLPPGLPDDFYARIARWSHKNKCRLIIDTSTQAALRQAIAEGVYLIKPNLREFRELTGSQLETETEQEEKAMEIVEQGQAEAVVLSLGAAGVMLVTQSGYQRLRAPTVPIRSKVGAGDSTVAGIVLSLARAWSLPKAVRFGVAAGAAAVMTPGTELCRREDTERLYENIRPANQKES